MPSSMPYLRLKSEEDGEDLEMQPLGASATDDDTPNLQEIESNQVGANLNNIKRWRHQQNLDEFFKRVYKFYQGKGMMCILTSRILGYITILFVFFLFLFLASCVDYAALYHKLHHKECPDGMLDTSTLTEMTCYGNRPIQFERMWDLPGGVYFLISSCLVVWVGYFINCLLMIPSLLDMKQFYEQALNIDSRSLQTIEWRHVVPKLIKAQQQYEICITVKELNALDITNLITRKENFLIALFNFGIIDTTIPLPYFGNVVSLPLTLQWTIEKCIWSTLFDRHNNLEDSVKKSNTDHAKFQRTVSSLQRNFKWMAIATFLFSPVAIAMQIVVFCFQNSRAFYKGSEGGDSPLAMRQWTPYARWRLRDYCEVEHIFQERLKRSYDDSLKYVSMFNSEILTIVCRFISFLAGGLMIMFILGAAIFDEELFMVDLTTNRSVTWWFGVLGTILAISRVFIPTENSVYKPSQLKTVGQRIHYFPKNWHHKEEDPETLKDFNQLFQYKVIVFLQELLSMLITPLVLYFRLPGCAAEICTFFRDNTVNQPGIGDVCDFALLKVSQNTDRGAQIGYSRRLQNNARFVEENKLEHSLANFSHYHDTWLPDPESKRFLQATEVFSSQHEMADIHASIIQDKYGFELKEETQRRQQRMQQQQQQQSQQQQQQPPSSRPVSQRPFSVLNNDARTWHPATAVGAAGAAAAAGAAGAAGTAGAGAVAASADAAAVAEAGGVSETLNYQQRRQLRFAEPEYSTLPSDSLVLGNEYGTE